jgi:CHAT domain-containing protein
MELPEEAVHLASGMLAAGFSQVISTIWPISDYYTPLIVDSFYEILMEEQTAPGNVETRIHGAHALHEAVRRLRERVGEEKFDVWVPFVHYGV